MFVERILKEYVKEKALVLDLCAAPGGKATLALSVLPEGSLLIANEPVRSRANILMENIVKWGYPNSVVTCNYARDFQFLGEVFDVVIADVPCSGEGMFRKDAGAIAEWSVSNVTTCQKRQREIVADIWRCLKPGGLLVYSTCTYNIYENEENVDWICHELGGRCLPVSTEPSWGVTGNLLGNSGQPCYHFFPHKTRGEGFFACAILKEEGSDTRSVFRAGKDKGKKGKASKAPVRLDEMLLDAMDYELHEEGDVFWCFPREYSALSAMLQHRLLILHQGIMLGEMKGKKFCPSHHLAMSTQLGSRSLATAEIDRDTAISYLRKEALVLDGSVAKGYVLLTHQGVPIGFVNNLGNRANNLYPEYWKIRQREQ